MTDINDRSPSRQPRSGLSFAAIAGQLNARIDEVAKRLLGEPNRDLSTRVQLRFGRNGSVAVELGGSKRGQWYDHENKLGGGALDLVSRCTGLSGRAAAEWAATELGIAAEQPSWPPRKRIVATYDYRDENANLLFRPQSCREGCSRTARRRRQRQHRLPARPVTRR